MKKLAILALGVLSLVACTDQKLVAYNTARLDNIEDYLRNNKYVKPQYFELLNNLKDFIEQNNYEVTIVGHTDSVGSNKYNFGLSRRRAESVKAKLIEFGLAEDRIAGIEAMGEEQPIATNETKEGRAQNRRVEFKLVQRENAPVATENK